MSARKVFLTIVAICLGGITLGLGLGAGYVITRHFWPMETVAEAPPTIVTDATLTTVRVNPLVVPIDTQEPCFVYVIPTAKSAVVSILVTSPAGGRGRDDVPGSGSGFIFAEDDDYIFVVTNNHVIENTNTIYISPNDYDTFAARVVGYDRGSDIAIVAASRSELEASGIPYTIATIGDSDILRMGDPVIAIGNAMGEGQTVTRGIISALSLNIEIPDVRHRLNLHVLQTDAAVNRGNSGGPLVNQHGEVIGIVTAKLIGADIEGMGYALPINNVLPLLTDILETGSVRRTFIGVDTNEVSEFLRNLFNLPLTGMIVIEVHENTPAYEAGIRRDDLIVQFDNRRIAGAVDWQLALDSARPGDRITLGIYREGERIEISVVLTSRMT